MKILVIFFLLISSALASKKTNYRANGLILYKQSSNNRFDDTFSIQNFSLNFDSQIDSDFQFVATINLKSNFDEVTGEKSTESDASEVFLKSNGIKRIELFFGKFYQSFNFLNTLKPQHRPFVFQTTLQRVSFGENGLNDIGASLRYRIETAGLSYINFQIYNPHNEVAFKDAKDNSLAYLLSYENVNILSKRKLLRTKYSATIADKEGSNAGTLYAGIETSFTDGEIYEDFTGFSQMFVFNYMYTARQLVENGYYNSISALYLFSIKRSIFGIGYENIGLRDKDRPIIHVGTGQYGYRFSKNVRTRLQWKMEKEAYKDTDHQFGLQVNFSIGDDYEAVTY